MVFLVHTETTKDHHRSSENHEVYEIFFMIKDRRIDPKIDPTTQRLFDRIVWTLIVLNILLGVPTIYYEYFYEETPEILRDTSIIQTNEI